MNVILKHIKVVLDGYQLKWLLSSVLHHPNYHQLSSTAMNVINDMMYTLLAPCHSGPGMDIQNTFSGEASFGRSGPGRDTGS